LYQRICSSNANAQIIPQCYCGWLEASGIFILDLKVNQKLARPQSPDPPPFFFLVD
jgi:hypothetical protein